MNGYQKNNYYFDYIFKINNPKVKNIIVVSHIVETSQEFLLSLNKNIGISLLIPKVSSLHQDTYNKIKSYIPIREINKEDIKPENENLFEYIKQIIGNQTFAICDIGGYFSKILLELDKRFGTKFIGIVEDTENGLKKYRHELKCIKKQREIIHFPIVSVAESPLKECEDYIVGKEICLKSEIFLSKNKIPLFGKKVLVLGFGKIGRSVATTFRERGAYVTVIDTNPIRQSLALSYGFITGKLHEELDRCELVVCATGNHCISFEDIQCIRRKVYFFSVTSRDDEFYKYEKMMRMGEIDRDNNLVITTQKKGIAIFVHNGYAINFQESRPILTNTIRLVQSELCESICTLHNFESGKISEISQERREFLASYWLEMQSERIDKI